MTATHADARSWTLPPMTGTCLTANHRVHWSRRAAITAEWRGMAWGITRQAKVPQLVAARIVVEWLPYDRRTRDPANASPMGKAAVDGIVQAGVLPDDSAAYLIGPDYRLGEVLRSPAGWHRAAVAQATLRVTITELPAGVVTRFA